MGACFSCLGLSRSSDQEPSETERLLYDDNAADRSGYGTARGRAADSQSRGNQEELRRQQRLLEHVCADTANNLIDVQHTTLMTLRGKPSQEFATLLNQHFPPAQSTPRTSSETPTNASSPSNIASSRTEHDPDQQDEAPHTPNPSTFPSSPPEPPSPFTRAQIAAARASQNGHARNGLSYAQAAATSPSPDTLRPAKGHTGMRGRSRADSRNGRQGDEHDDYEHDEDAAEEAWLASVTGGKDPLAVGSLSAEQGHGLVVHMPGVEDESDSDVEETPAVAAEP